MYVDEMIVIGKVENGFMVGIRVPYNDSDEGMVGGEMKQFFTKTAEEAGAKTAEILPKLKDKMDADAVFKLIVKETANE